ncbi:MAG: DUF2892 domain-containing protein [Armatimonadota bacterium]
MTIEKALRIMAGIMILLSAALTHFVSPWWILLTIFIGVNLLQSGFTNWCPAISLFKALGLRGCVPQSQTDDTKR